MRMNHSSTVFLLKHQIFRKWKAAQQRQEASFGQLPSEEEIRMAETRIYVGLNDSETKKQIHETEYYLDRLKEICVRFHVQFSVVTEEGGYFHEDGEYVEEASLVVTLIDAERETVRKIAEELRTLFHQESVLVTEDEVRGYFYMG